jgi:type VI secretion system protein ImpL
VRIVGITNAGRSVEIFNEPGRFGLTRMFEVAQRKKLAGGINELSWTQNGQTVTLQLRVISQPGSPTAPATTANGSQGSAPAPVTGTSFKGLKLPALVVGADAPAQVADATTAPSSIVKSTAAVSASGASR